MLLYFYVLWLEELKGPEINIGIYVQREISATPFLSQVLEVPYYDFSKEKNRSLGITKDYVMAGI